MFAEVDSYLVKLGWDVNKNSLQTAFKSLNLFEGQVKSISGLANSSLGIAAKAVTSIIFELSKATFNFASAIANTDLETERFARRMWTSERAARAFNTALESLDYSGYEDIFYMTPEEYNRFINLRNFLTSLEAPEGAQKTLKTIRDINGEISKFKAISSYLTQWIIYYLGKYSSEEIKELHNGLKDLNKFFVDNIDKISEKIGKFLSIIVRLCRAGVYGIEIFKELIKIISDILPSGMVKAAIGVGGFIALFNAGPIGAFLAAIMALLLILEDLYVYKKGGKSALQGLWEQFDKVKNMDTTKLDEFKTKLDDVSTSLASIRDNVVELFKKLGEYVDLEDGINLFFKNCTKTAEAFNTVLENINSALDFLMHGFDSKTFGKIKENFYDENGRFDVNKGSKYIGSEMLSGFFKTQGLFGGQLPAFFRESSIENNLKNWINEKFNMQEFREGLFSGLSGIVEKKSNVYDTKIEIKDSNNPKKTAEAVKDELISLFNGFPRFQE